MSGKYREVSTKDAAPEVLKLGTSASKWKTEDLDLLGVDYQYDKFEEIKTPVEGMPQELVELIDSIAANIQTVDMTIVKRRGAYPECMQMLSNSGLMQFAPAYISLGTLLARVRRSTGIAPVIYSTPPGQTTVPQDPNLSGGSSGSSGSDSSGQSKGEPYVNDFATEFLKTTFFIISPWVGRVQWMTPRANAFLLSHANTKMKLRLGKAQLVTAIDDGGVSMAFRREGSAEESHRVVLSVEAKRKKHRKDNKSTADRHAAQIFAEMLGQVLYTELFETLDNDYQEAFVIHIRHTKVYLFYAKFPNTYLSRIYEHGAKYSQLFPSPEDKITLCQSPAYSMNNAADQAKLFRDLAKLLWYLSSGRSHVGYLCNCPRNSFVEKLPRVIQDCVVVRRMEDYEPADPEEIIGDTDSDEEMDEG